MRLGYVAKSKAGASVDDQREALADIGVMKVIPERVWKRKPRKGENPRPERSDLIEILRPGDELCVLSAVNLADSVADLFAVLAAVTARDASVYVIDMGESFTADESHARVARVMQKDKRRGDIAKARDARKNQGGRPPALSTLTRAEWAEFDRQWRDDAVSIPQMAARWKVSPATVSRKATARKLGPKA